MARALARTQPTRLFLTLRNAGLRCRTRGKPGPAGTGMGAPVLNSRFREEIVGAILLWLLGVPIPIIILLLLLWH